MTGLQVPIVVVIIGEGGSGGALAIGVGDEVLALENATYSVISPEGCAAILWRAPEAAPTAAAAMRMTAADQLELGVIDGVIEEPGEGASTITPPPPPPSRRRSSPSLAAITRLETEALLTTRYARLRGIGLFRETETASAQLPRSRPFAAASDACCACPACRDGRAGARSGRAARTPTATRRAHDRPTPSSSRSSAPPRS